MNRAALAASALFALVAAPAFAGVIPVGHFEQIALRGGGHVSVKHGATQSVTLLSGDPAYTKFSIRRGGELRIDACEGNCPNHYTVEVEIVTPELSGASIEGGGHIDAEGGFPQQHEFDAAVSGGGHIDMRAISAADVDAAVNGGGHIQVTATEKLEAAVSGGGAITYDGDPEVEQAINGGGSVSRASK